MIKSNELRLGNLIRWEDDSHDVIIVVGVVHDKHDEDCAIYTDKKELAAIWEFKPILLTEEWLVKFNWEKIDGNDFTFLDNNCFMINTSGQLYYMKDYTAVNIDYIHQLQNLYFALTGNELTLKQ